MEYRFVFENPNPLWQMLWIPSQDSVHILGTPVFGQLSFPRQGVIHCFEQRIVMSLTYSEVQIQAKHIMTAKNRGLH